MRPFHSTIAKTYKLTVEDCIAIDMVTLRQKGLLLDWMDHHYYQQWYNLAQTVGDCFLTITFTGDIAYPTLRIEGNCFGKPIRQTIRLVSKRMRFGGKKWYFMCPSTRRLCRKLILPPGGQIFASRKAWGLAYTSQNIDAVARANKAVAALRKRCEALPNRAHRNTREALEKRLEAKEAFLDRIEEQCMWDITHGRRMSLRRAAKAAVAARRRNTVEL